MQNSVLAALERFDLATTFDKYNIRNCHRLSLMTDAEDDLARGLSSIDVLSEEDWRPIRGEVDLDLAARLCAFSLRMASLATRSNSAYFIASGLAALILDDEVIDPRDVCTLCCILYDAAIRIGASPDLIFRRVAKSATPTRRQLLEGFVDGPSYMRSLGSMGVELIKTAEGQSYKISRV